MKKIIIYFITCLFMLYTNYSQSTIPEWQSLPPFPEALHGHSSILLPDGNILISGGINSLGNAVNSAYIFNFKTGEYRKVTSMSSSRAYHSLVVIPENNGASIFVIGGYSGSSGNYSSVRSVEKVNYQNGQVNINWISLDDMDIGRGDCRATWDKSNRIIINGGIVQSGGQLRSGSKVSSSEYVEISTNRLFSLPNMGKERAGHFLGTILDANGDDLVITAGGEQGTTTTELFENNDWSSHAFAPREYRYLGASFVDIGGIARVIGGYNENGDAHNTCEWYDVKSGWKYTASMFRPRAETDVTFIGGITDSSRSYLTVGGNNSSGAIKETEYYTLPTTSSPTGIWSQLGDLVESGSNREVAIDGNNLALVFGGKNNSDGAMNGVEVYQPLSANDATFSPEEVGRISDSIPITITNSWLLPVKVNGFRMSNPGEFFFTGDTADFVLQPGQSRRINSWFRPSAEGNRNGLILFNIGYMTDTVKLAGTGIKSSIEIVTNSQEFGEIFVGSDTTICFEAIRNNGTDTTYIDSISISPRGNYTVVSPNGRVNIPPDSTLEICIRFNPSERGRLLSSAIVNIADRSYPSGLSGTGVLKYLSGYGPNGCDTLVYEEGSTYQTSIILENPGDRDITVTGYQFIGGNVNLYSMTNNFSFNIAKGGDKEIFVDFTPVAEGTFKIDVQFEHDGNQDSTVIIPLCYVVRSKNIRFSVSELDFGTICSGDSITKVILIENPSSIETITIDRIKKDDPLSPIIIPSSIDTILNPRESMTLTVSIKGNNSGIINETVEIGGSFGSTDIPVKAEILPNIVIEPNVIAHYYDPGESFIVPYDISGIDAGNPLTKIEVTTSYNSTMLYPLRIVELNGGVALDQANTEITLRNVNSAEMTVTWQNGLIADGAAFGVEYEVLRGNSHFTTIRIEDKTLQNVCLTGNNAEFYVEGLCGGRDSQILTENATIFNVYPLPVGNEMNILLYDKEDKEFEIEIYDQIGKRVYQNNLNVSSKTAAEFKINTVDLSNGTYVIRLKDGYQVLYNKVIILTK
ncbi:MAG: kelch repeat-containing protein [Candidatus Kapaibacterium sp.]